MKKTDQGLIPGQWYPCKCNSNYYRYVGPSKEDPKNWIHTNAVINSEYEAYAGDPYGFNELNSHESRLEYFNSYNPLNKEQVVKKLMLVGISKEKAELVFESTAKTANIKKVILRILALS